MKTIIRNNCPPQLGIILISVFMLFGHNLKAQEGYFEQGYGNEFKEAGYGIVINTNYTVAIAGYQERAENSNKDFVLVLTDSLGDTLWTKFYGGSANEVAYSLIKTDDGGYLLSGYSESYGTGSKDIYIVKTDGSGNTQWTKVIGSNGIDEVARAVVKVPFVGYAIAGYKETSVSISDILLVKIELDGDIIWQNTYGGDDLQYGYDVLRKANGTIAVTGVDYNYTVKTAFILETDSNGVQLNYFQLDTEDPIESRAFDFGFTSGYVLAGNIDDGTSLNGFWAKVSDNGAITEQQSYGGNATDEFNDIRRIGGAVVLLGKTSSRGEGYDDMWVVFTDSIGDTVKTFTAGGVGVDEGHGLYYDKGRVYTVGYNDSYGIGETGNIYETRFDLQGIYDVINAGVAEGNPEYYLAEPIDCAMKRVLYVEKLTVKNGENIICSWCGSGDFYLDESELENGSTYGGVIGNTTRENDLLAFCKKHQFKEIIFYEGTAVFAQEFPGGLGSWNANPNFSYYVQNITGITGNMRLDEYLKWRLNKFIVKALKPDVDGFRMDHVGVSIGGFADENHWHLVDNLTQYNMFVNQEAYNYKRTGKISTFTLEHEFWSLEDVNDFSASYTNHKTYLQRMVDLRALDMNIQIVSDYITYLTDNINHEDNTPSNSNISTRAGEIENIVDNTYHRYYLDRLYLTYYTTSTNTYIGGGTGYYPFQRDDYSYRTTVFGKRTGGVETRVFPLFSSQAASLGIGVGNDFLGMWLATRDGTLPTETRYLVDAETRFMNAYPNSYYYSHADAGANKKFNGFVYFTYQLLQQVSDYNITNGHTVNFSNNNSTPYTNRISKSSYSSLISNPCYRYTPYIPSQMLGKPKQDSFNAGEGMVGYPNPIIAQSEVIVTFPDREELVTQVRIQVINLLGEVCIDVHANWDVDNRGYLIDTSMLKSGMYLMLAKDARGNKFQTKMLVRR